MHILLLALKDYKSISKAFKVTSQLLLLSKRAYGGNGRRKLFRFGDKYYSDYFMPGYPSKAYDGYIEKKFGNLLPLKKKTNALTFIIFGITTKCPLHCEHCFEWENLNKKETFSLSELKQIVHKYQEEGICQFHLSGGEPMVRIKDVIELIKAADKGSEFWIYTSGFNFTRENAKVLVGAGATGVVVSLDHFDAVKHNSFRGLDNSFEWAVQAIQNAKIAGLLVAVSLCVTRSFVSWVNLLQYIEFVKSLGVHFIQILEPKAVGHYQGKQISLTSDQLRLLEKLYLAMNFDRKYKDYPTIIYHGYHQRRIGCFSGGYDNMYIDSAGNVDACPFCQTKLFNIKDLLESDRPLSENYINLRCPEFGKMKF